MKIMIYLVLGKSGSGKSTIINNLKQENIKPKINIIKSYTTRKQRDMEDTDHTFINKKDIKKYEKDIVASSWINDEFYFATKQQFKKDYANIYIVDKKGIEDIKKTLNDEDFVVVEIKTTKNYDIDDERRLREITTKIKESDVVLFNDSTIDDAVNDFTDIINTYWK